MKKKNGLDSTQADVLEAEKTQKMDKEVWTRDSIVNVNKMKQPKNFAELIEGKYMDEHIEN
jgi:hypothetical protein